MFLADLPIELKVEILKYIDSPWGAMMMMYVLGIPVITKSMVCTIETGLPIKTYIFGLKHGEHFNNSTRIEYFYLGLFHRDNDLPARIMVQRDDYEWHQYGKCHRDNGLPAIIRPFGYKEWCINGVRDRPNNLPVIESDIMLIYQKNSRTHRDGDLPARIREDIQEWFIDGKKHRWNGPAYIQFVIPDENWKTNYARARHPDDVEEWWLHGKQVPKCHALYLYRIHQMTQLVQRFIPY